MIEQKKETKCLYKQTFLFFCYRHTNTMTQEKLVTKNWVGNQNSIYKTLGASNHTEEDRQTNDYYATSPQAVDMLLTLETFNKKIWECACGEGHISKVLENAGYEVYSTDLVDRTYGIGNKDFLNTKQEWEGDIITNPPYKHAQEFVEKALSIIPEGNKVAMFLKLQFLEGKKRKLLFAKNPPRTVWVSSSRLKCGKNGEFGDGSSAVAYCWFVWEKGFVGDTVVRWFN